LEPHLAGREAGQAWAECGAKPGKRRPADGGTDTPPNPEARKRASEAKRLHARPAPNTGAQTPGAAGEK